MTKNIFIVAAFLLAFITPALAADFTATVDSNNVVAGEGFSLQLTLSGTSAKNGPDTGPLQQSFTVVSEGQSSNTTIINGKVDSSVGWDLTLIPKKGGSLTIPSVSIDTDAGTLHTQPITLTAESAAAQPTKTAGHNNISIAATANPKDPYQNQPISYTVTVTARANISNVSLGDMTIDHAIVQQQGKPEISDQVENGVPAKVITFRYLITPLTPHKITIPPAVLQGDIETQEDPRRQNMMDPFHMLQNMGSFGFNFKPFSIASNEVDLDVKPPAAAMDPWLPLHSLQINESMDSQQAKVGEPITRKLVLLADGAVGSQLPSLETQQNHTDFKVYGDKPSIGEDIDKKTGEISGWRRESYSLIPQKTGKLVLPEIKVPWWDIANNKIAYAELPEQTIDVLPGAATPTQSVPPITTATPQATAPPPVTTQPQPAATEQRPSILYAVVAVLVLGLLLVVFWAFSLQRKINRLGTSPVAENKTPANPKPSNNKTDLGHVKTAQELSRYLQTYAEEHWGAAKNTSLEDIFLSLQKSRSGLAADEINAVVKELTAALYAGKTVDMEQLKARCSNVISSVSKRDTAQKPAPEKLQRLNPS